MDCAKRSRILNRPKLLESLGIPQDPSTLAAYFRSSKTALASESEVEIEDCTSFKEQNVDDHGVSREEGEPQDHVGR
jgi:hypothetical protein